MELDEICEALLGFTEFETPVTKPVDYNATIGGDISFEARELLRVATQYRVTLMDGIENSGMKVDPRNVVSAVETYLPYVYKITRSMEHSASAQIKLNKPLEFSWTSALKKGKAKEHKEKVLVFEVCFILTVQALAHYNVARFMLGPEQKSRTANLVAAAKEVRKGSGILEFVSQVLIPRWVNPPPTIPPEVKSKVISALSQSFLCVAQRISVVQAIQKKSSPSVIAKLCFGLSERYRTVNAMFQHLDCVDTIQEAIVDEAPLMVEVCYSLGLYFLGVNSRANEKPGEAVAYLRFASEKLSLITFTAAMNLLYRGRVDDLRREVDDKYLNFKADNESIYFDGVPTRDRLEIPTGSFIINPQDYSLPDVEPISFASTGQTKSETSPMTPPPAPAPAQDKRKSFSSWFGIGGSSSSSSGNASSQPEKLEAPPGYDKEVFEGLPEDIQKEVIAQYQAEKQRK